METYNYETHNQNVSSNYLSPVQTLSPSRVQTKFEENSLPARFTRSTDIMLGCIVLGEKNAFPVDFDTEKTIGHLKRAIKKEKSVALGNTDADALKLWKVNIPESEKYDIYKGIDIKEKFGGEELDSDLKTIGQVFEDQPSSEHIHIIVELPATTGKRQLDLDDFRDQKKGKLTETILTRAKKIMEYIKKLPENRNIYSNPETLIPLPFPFLGDDKPVDRFSIKDGNFLYMGRKAFDDVLDIINSLVLGDGYKKCFIYGTMGYGKSYILAAIVCFLIRNGKRVAYLPDCRELAKDTKDYVKSALYLAYENDSDKINKIHACKTSEEIIEFCKEESEPLYIVVDQLNALDGHSNTEISESDKQRIMDLLNRMTARHYYIKSSSANNKSALHLALKQTNEKRIVLYGGFDEDEMLQWWINNNFNLPDEQKKRIEYITGRNPLFLSFLPGPEKNFEDALNHLKPILVEKIKMPMTNFSDIIKGERWDIHVKLMSSCLTNGYAPSGYGINDYDHRFFYINKDERCHYTSGFVRDCMADYLFEKGKLEVFATSSWIQCIKEFRNNPSVKGFMVEKACLSSIYKNGIMAGAINFKCDNYKFFTSIEEIDLSTNEGSCTFYLPRCWNQKSIDGLITLYRLDTLYIVPIQITIDKETHSDSEASFLSGIWPELKSKISGNLKVEVKFVWITHENDADTLQEKIRQSITEINPEYIEYTSTVIAFNRVNIELENVLLLDNS